MSQAPRGGTLGVMNASRQGLKILAFEPFDVGSHRAVRESIARYSRHHWRWFTRPGRAWKWRMRLAAIELLEEARAAGGLEQRSDAVFVTSLMSAADLAALMPQKSPAGGRRVPVILYMHENQAAYPARQELPAEGIPGASLPAEDLAGADLPGVDLPGAELPGAERDVHFALTNLTSMLASDLVIFNSQWNRRSFVAGIAEILRHAPDSRLGHIGRWIEERSEVIWPPVEPPPETVFRRRASERPGPGDGQRGGSGHGRVLHNSIAVLWPHRWEHDKGPDQLLEIARRYTEKLNLRWTILGQSFSTVPHALRAFGDAFRNQIDHMGFEPDRRRYWEHLAACDWVLSTARHEFFGIAVVEALLAGCLPWLPDALSYPELLPVEARRLSPMNPPDDASAIRAAIRRHLHAAIAPHAVSRLDDAISRCVACGH